LEQGHIRLLSSPEDIARCNEAIVQHHYLHDATLVGEHMRYAFVYKGQWLAVATWSAAAFILRIETSSSAGVANSAAAAALFWPIIPVCWSCPIVDGPTSSAAS